MGKTYWDGLIESIEESDRDYARVREAKRELKEERARKEKERIKNLNIRRKNMAKLLTKVAVAGGMVLLVATKTDDAINAFIEWDNKNFSEEAEWNISEAERLTGKTREELLGQPTPDYDALREEAEEASKTDLDRKIEEYLNQLNEENLQNEYESQVNNTEYSSEKTR